MYFTLLRPIFTARIAIASISSEGRRGGLKTAAARSRRRRERFDRLGIRARPARAFARKRTLADRRPSDGRADLCEPRPRSPALAKWEQRRRGACAPPGTKALTAHLHLADTSSTFCWRPPDPANVAARWSLAECLSAWRLIAYERRTPPHLYGRECLRRARRFASSGELPPPAGSSGVGHLSGI